MFKSFINDLKKHPVVWTIIVLFTAFCVAGAWSEGKYSTGFLCFMAAVLPGGLRQGAYKLGIVDEP